MYAMSERVLPTRVTLPERLGMGSEDRFEVVRGELVVSLSPGGTLVECWRVSRTDVFEVAEPFPGWFPSLGSPRLSRSPDPVH